MGYEIKFNTIILPIEIVVGCFANIIAFLIWQFGAKSKLLFCASYFAVAAVLDLLYLALPGVIYYLYQVDPTTFPPSDGFCRLTYFAQFTLGQSGKWISVALTVERSLTILFPFVFKSNGIQRRSKFIQGAVIVLISLANISYLICLKYKPEVVDCVWYDKYKTVYDFYATYDIIFGVLLPSVLIVVFNAVSMVSLCKKKFQSKAGSRGRNEGLSVFTKLVLATGLLHILTNSLWIFVLLGHFQWYKIELETHVTIVSVAMIVLYSNSILVPFMYFIVCTSFREDFKTFTRCLALPRCCRRRQTAYVTRSGIPTSNTQQSVVSISQSSP